jgi:serine protease Do
MSCSRTDEASQQLSSPGTGSWTWPCSGSAHDLPAAVVGDSERLRPGELVLAAGHPFGMAGAVVTGVVHATPGHAAPRWIQADLRLAPGNSGGPMADARGRVIGINAMIAGRLALAVPSHVVGGFLQRCTGP